MGKYLLPDVWISSSWQGHRDRTPPSKEPGTDFALAYGSPVYAPYDGTVRVVHSTPDGAPGRYVGIDLTDGNYFRALHLRNAAVTPGQKVRRGDLIAYSGSSGWGRDTGYDAHVHLSLWVGTDPLKAGYAATTDIVAYSNAGAPASVPSTAPAAAFRPIPEEDDMTRNFISTSSSAPKYELGLNSKRSVSKAEWDAIRAIEAAGGPKVVVAIVPQATLNAIPGK